MRGTARLGQNDTPRSVFPNRLGERRKGVKREVEEDWRRRGWGEGGAGRHRGHDLEGAAAL